MTAIEAGDIAEEYNKLAEEYNKLLRSYVAQLTTLGASKSKWVQWVVRNGKARLEHITGESYESHFQKFN